jgi:ATP-dependent Clp protease ATP-binding subunit ClpA
MKLCSICNKNIATIFTAKMAEGKTETVGVCLQCAKKMGIPVIDQLMQQTGMSAEDVENLSEQMNEMLKDVNIEELGKSDMFMNLMNGAFPEPVDYNKDEEKKPLPQKKVKDEGKDKEEKKKPKRKFLDTYGTNLTDKASEKKVDKVIGRHREIDRVIQILNRRTKNNPILIGEPGVGKTAIAEG